VTDPQDQYDALYDLWQVYLHMRAWGRPEYPDLSAEAREQFTELVETRALFTYVEDCKRDVLRAGVEVPDPWLNVLFAAHLTPDEPLPQAEADRLGVILAEMYPMLVRLDPDARPLRPDTDRRDPVPVSETPAGGAGNEGIGDGDADVEFPSLTENEVAVITTLARFDPMRLASVTMIESEMDAGSRRSPRKIGEAVNRLIELDLAERPRGDRSGARLTTAGRRVARKVAD
jgi:hypothetical protein